MRTTTYGVMLVGAAVLLAAASMGCGRTAAQLEINGAEGGRARQRRATRGAAGEGAAR